MRAKNITAIAAYTVFIVLSFLFIQPPDTVSGDRENTPALTRRVTKAGNQERTDFIDENGSITTASDVGYATKIVIYDTAGSTERYYDAEGTPVCSKTNGFGQNKERDEYGNIIRITYVDQNGNPMRAGGGYATIERYFYPQDSVNKGRVEKEFYYDEYGNPLRLPAGFFGVYREYDEHGENTASTYLDTDGNPMVNAQGYARVVRGYYPTYYTEMYYGLDGNPARLSDGQYGIKKGNGSIVYLDEKGREQFNTERFLYNHSRIAILIALMLLLLSNAANKEWNVVFAVLFTVAIIYLTLLFRESGNTSVTLEPFRSYRKIFTDAETRSAILRNIWLFVPLGGMLRRIWPQKTVLLIPVILSVAAEVIQYQAGTGYCETDDIISNGLGGILGYEGAVLLTDIRRLLSHDGKDRGCILCCSHHPDSHHNDSQ